MAGLLILAFHLTISSATAPVATTTPAPTITGDGDRDCVAELSQRKVITEKDYSYFSSFSPTPLDVCNVMLKLLHEATRKGLFLRKLRVSEVDNAVLSLMTDNVFCIQENAESISDLIRVQLPFPFVQLVGALVYCFIIQLFLVASAYIADGIHTNNVSSLIIGGMTILSYNTLLLAMLRLFTVLSNPFRDEAADFPVKTYAAHLEERLQEMATSASALDDLVNLDDDDDEEVESFDEEASDDSQDITASDPNPSGPLRFLFHHRVGMLSETVGSMRRIWSHEATRMQRPVHEDENESTRRACSSPAYKIVPDHEKALNDDFNAHSGH